MHAETETDQVRTKYKVLILKVIDETKDRPAVQLANVIFNPSCRIRGASDVHIEPFGNRTRIRFRNR